MEDITQESAFGQKADMFPRARDGALRGRAKPVITVLHTPLGAHLSDETGHHQHHDAEENCRPSFARLQSGWSEKYRWCRQVLLFCGRLECAIFNSDAFYLNGTIK